MSRYFSKSADGVFALVFSGQVQLYTKFLNLSPSFSFMSVTDYLPVIWSLLGRV